MDRIATVKTLATAWQLIDFLSREFSGCHFQVEMPARESFQVWPARGFPLHPEERALIASKLKAFRQLATA
jgi:hypothetical protein